MKNELKMLIYKSVMRIEPLRASLCVPYPSGQGIRYFVHFCLVSLASANFDMASRT